MANLVTFAKKLWKDKVGGNTPITAAELNRIESGVNDCATQINKLGDSVSRFDLKQQAVAVYFSVWSDGGASIDIKRNDGKTVSIYFKNSNFSQSVR